MTLNVMVLQTSDNIVLSYKTYGSPSSQPILLVHGLGAEMGMWETQANRYEAHGFFVIILDLRGHGKSTKVASFRVRDCAKDVAELVDYLAIPKVTVIGVSLGGLVAQQFACDYPDKVDRLIISDSFSSAKTLLRKLAGWSQWVTLKLFPQLLRKALKFAYEGEALYYLQKAICQMDRQQLLGARAGINHFDITDRLGQISCPTLVLVGSRSKMAIKMAKETAGLIRGAAFQVLEGGMDPSSLTVASAFDQAVLDFLKT